MNYILGYEVIDINYNVIKSDNITLNGNFFPSYWRSLFRTFKEDNKTVTIQPIFSRVLDDKVFETSATHKIKLRYVDFYDFYTCALREPWAALSTNYKPLIKRIWNEHEGCGENSYIMLTLNIQG